MPDTDKVSMRGLVLSLDAVKRGLINKIEIGDAPQYINRPESHDNKGS